MIKIEGMGDEPRYELGFAYNTRMRRCRLCVSFMVVIDVSSR